MEEENDRNDKKRKHLNRILYGIFKRIIATLSHKQTLDNPWDKYEDEFGVGTLHTAEITDTNDKGATVDLNEDVVAFIPSRHLEKEDGKKLKKGDTAEFKVIEFNKEFKRVVASHTAIFREEEQKNIQVAAKKQQANEKTTLGDLDALQELKDKMEGKN